MKKVLLLCFLFVKPLLFASSIIIGIAGGSGAGKTTLADKLKESLGDDVAIIRQDNYYKDLTHLSMSEREKTNFDAPNSLDFALLHSHLVDLKEGLIIQQPTYDFTTHNRTDVTIDVYPKKIIIIEGSLLLAIPEIREICDMKLYIDVDMDICLCRRIERDQRERGRNFTDIRNQYLSTVRPMFLKYVAPSKSYADLIIPNETKNAVVLDFITTLFSNVINSPLSYQTFKGNHDE
ncbi:MAG: Uridine kinase [Chlamydiae bacterium]|nr:Uridine kinase [Chlamydiota bacterium]